MCERERKGRGNDRGSTKRRRGRMKRVRKGGGRERGGRCRRWRDGVGGRGESG